MKRATLCLAALLVACGVDSTPDIAPSSLPLLITDGTAGDHASLRYALVFSYPGEIRVTVDGEVRLGETMSIPLRTPSGSWAHNFASVEVATLPSLTEILIYRPRVVVYEDVDESGDFFPTTSTGGVDRVMAIDNASSGASIAAVLDLDYVLSNLSLEETQDYYTATGGRYTPFVRVTTEAGVFKLLRDQEAGAMELAASSSPVAAEHLACDRRPIYVYGSATQSQPLVAHVDSALSAPEVCGISIVDCRQETLSEIEAPSLGEHNSYASQRSLQCRANAWYEVLLVHTAVLTCGGCQCNYDTLTDAYFALPGSTPPWWPCGSELTVCESTQPLYEIDAECEAE